MINTDPGGRPPLICWGFQRDFVVAKKGSGTGDSKWPWEPSASSPLPGRAEGTCKDQTPAAEVAAPGYRAHGDQGQEGKGLGHQARKEEGAAVQAWR